MAEYTPKNWQCGETITADALNHMEQGIKEASEGGGCDCGYECTETSTILTEETVTTTKMEESSPSASGGLSSYGSFINADEIILTLDGTEYVLQREVTSSGNFYKGQNELPTAFSSAQYGNSINTQNEGTYSVKIEVPSLSVETTPCFKKAVESAMPEDKMTIFNIEQTGQNEWTPSIPASDLNMLWVDSALVGIRSNKHFYFMERRSGIYGSYDLIFANISVENSAVKLQIFTFNTMGSSSFEEKTLAIQ